MLQQQAYPQQQQMYYPQMQQQTYVYAQPAVVMQPGMVYGHPAYGAPPLVVAAPPPGRPIGGAGDTALGILIPWCIGLFSYLLLTAQSSSHTLFAALHLGNGLQFLIIGIILVAAGANSRGSCNDYKNGTSSYYCEDVSTPAIVIGIIMMVIGLVFFGFFVSKTKAIERKKRELASQNGSLPIGYERHYVEL